MRLIKSIKSGLASFQILQSTLECLGGGHVVGTIYLYLSLLSPIMGSNILISYCIGFFFGIALAVIIILTRLYTERKNGWMIFSDRSFEMTLVATIYLNPFTLPVVLLWKIISRAICIEPTKR